MTLAATGILTVAVLALLVLIAWPSRAEAARAEPAHARQARVSPPYTASHRDAGGKPRAATARALAASGTAIVDIARRTGLSRDALVLMSGMSGMSGMTGKSGSATATARQKAPAAARLSLFQRLRGTGGATATGTQVPA
ncbi:MAG: hypothetical protein IT360_21685 [Gemmatimonadaceae bacterium]|nr:hypothetical protein [Gemmatimonadaceae bacterium]